MKRLKRRKYRKLAKKKQQRKKERDRNKVAHNPPAKPKRRGLEPNNILAEEYSVEHIYKLVGRDDKVAVLTFHPESEAYKKFGNSCTVVFCYDNKEREALETNFKSDTDKRTFGFVKVKPLAMELNKEQTDELMNKGINTKDIQHMLTSPWATENPFYKEEKRNLRKIEIPFHAVPKGGDYNWMYGFEKRNIRNGVKLIPSSMELYLAMKLFFEPDKITEEEKLQIYDNGTIRNSIERKFLEIKLDKEVSTEEEDDRFFELSKLLMNSNLEILKTELNRAGTNLSKLFALNKGLCYHLMQGTYLYIPERLNGFNGVPIYLDWKGYIHVFTRHVNEFTVSERFADKDKLLWHPRDVIPVIGNVIKQVDGEIQEFWNKNPISRYSKYGVQSLYFEGDYYTFHVEPDGRISTFHRHEKRL